MLFRSDVFKRISDLSGGERGRVSLAKLMLSDANFLILDEPTNHLDITSKEILESALNQYTGTVFFVSHDRYFINQTATRILELTGETVVNYIGNYDYYLEKHDIMTQLYVKPQEISDIQAGKQDDAVNKLDWQAHRAAGIPNKASFYSAIAPLPVNGLHNIEEGVRDRKSTRLNSSHKHRSRMPSSA